MEFSENKVALCIPFHELNLILYEACIKIGRFRTEGYKIIRMHFQLLLKIDENC